MVVIKIDEQNGVHENIIIATVVCSIRDDIVSQEVLLKANGTESISDAVFLSWYYIMNNECGNWRIPTDKREMKRPERVILNHKWSNMGRLMGIPDLKNKIWKLTFTCKNVGLRAYAELNAMNMYAPS